MPRWVSITHALAHAHEAALAVADAVDRDEAVEAHTHHAVGGARRARDRGGAAMVAPGGEQRRRNRIAGARRDAPAVDRAIVTACPRYIRQPANIEPPRAEGADRVRGSLPAAISGASVERMVGGQRDAGVAGGDERAGSVADWS